MSVSKRPVYVWGFPPEALEEWPQDLEPVPVTALPVEGPLLVHSAAALDFQAQALRHPQPDGRLQPAVLYQVEGTPAPPDAWTFFDATVEAGDWEAVRRMLACPQQWEVAEWAEDVPAARLAEVLAGLRAPAGAAAALKGLPLPAAVREHLTTCETCRRAFAQTLEQRQRWRYQVVCPPVERLAAYVRTAADDWVAAHLPACAACRAEVAVLRRLQAPERLIIRLSRLPSDLAAAIQAGTAKWRDGLPRQEGLVVLFNALLRAQMQPVGAWSRARGATGDLKPEEARGLLEHLRRQEALTLIQTDGELELELRWSEPDEMLWIEGLRGAWGEPIERFQLEIQQDDVVRWSADSQAGRAAIPLARLEEILGAGEATLIIRVPEPPDEGEA